jgi:hypothetical protein
MPVYQVGDLVKLRVWDLEDDPMPSVSSSRCET